MFLERGLQEKCSECQALRLCHLHSQHSPRPPPHSDPEAGLPAGARVHTPQPDGWVKVDPTPLEEARGLQALGAGGGAAEGGTAAGATSNSLDWLPVASEIQSTSVLISWPTDGPV